MPEMILPGTYIEVRAEKLIAAGPISISNVGVVGTARRGALLKVLTPANIGEARDMFGQYDPYDDPETPGAPLTLVRALELAFANGAQRVFAVRVASGDGVAAEYTLGTVTFTATGPGSGYNQKFPGTTKTQVEIMTETVAAGLNVSITVDRRRENWRDVPAGPLEFAKVLNGTHPTYAYRTKSSTGGGSELFTVAAPEAEAAAAAAVTTAAAATTAKAAAEAATEAATAATTTATETAADPLASPAAVAAAADAATAATEAATAAATAATETAAAAVAATATAATAAATVVAPGKATQTVVGLNGAAALPGDYNLGLDALANENVHIMVLAGQPAADMADDLIAHCQNASSDLMKHERIGVIGSDPSKTRADLVAPPEDDGRLISVGPGIKTTDGASGRDVTLPGSYAAAAVAGRISSLDPHISPTNKTLNANGLETVFNGTELEQLVLGRVLALEFRSGGIRLVKGITTSTNTAWAQVTTRRIVDYARFGVRSACDPYLGKLNNDRVRQSMKGTINGFLADMVDREMLINYEIDVTATREQQIRGIAQVSLVLRPTFSIDYIRVIMNLE